MYKGKKIGLVIPAYNEEKLIRPTLEQVPDWVDSVYVIDDASEDGTAETVSEQVRVDPRILLIQHLKNEGPGGAIITGYLRASADNCDIVAVTGGDLQMPLEELDALVDPLLCGHADYTKGNRFLHPEGVRSQMPTSRLVGNIFLTGLTKVASGYYKIMDVVDGYTAITREAIDLIDWSRGWKGYGYPLDFLIRLNAYSLRVQDVPRRAIYLKGERQSQIRALRYALRVTPMLLHRFFWRLVFKYVYRDFHPLVLFFLLGFLLLPTGLLFGTYLLYEKLCGGHVSGPQAVFCALAITTGLQFLLFAMLFDMYESE